MTAREPKTKGQSAEGGRSTRRCRCGLVAVLALAASALLAAPAVADELVFETRWGHAGDGNGEFFYPQFLELDSSGNVFVSDAANDRIQVFDSDGNFIRKWGSPGSAEGEFHTNLGVAIDSADNVYVVDQGNARIEAFDSDGNFIRMWGWGVDDGTAALQTCTSGCQAGIPGSGDGQFGADSAGAMAVDSADNVYVVDPVNDRIQVFDSNGNFIRKWGTPSGTGDGQFDEAGGIAVDGADNVFVGDFPAIDSHGNVVHPENLRVQVLDSMGNFIRKWGSEGTGAGKFKLYASVGDVDSSGNVFVTSAKRGGDPATEAVPGRVEMFDSADSFVREWGGMGSEDVSLPSDVAVDGTGNIYVTSQHEVDKYRLIPGPDTAVADPKVSAQDTQSLQGGVEAKFRSDEQVTGVATGEIVVSGKSKAGARTYKLKREEKSNDPGRGETLKLKPKRSSDAKKIAKALKNGKKATAELTVTLTDGADNTQTQDLSVKLKR